MTANNTLADNLSSSICSGPALFLAVHAHDIEHACGGVRQLHIQQGDGASIVVVRPPEDTLGLDYNEASIARVVDEIAQSKACVVYAPWPGEQDINRHTLALVAREAVRRTGGHCVLAHRCKSPYLSFHA